MRGCRRSAEVQPPAAHLRSRLSFTVHWRVVEPRALLEPPPGAIPHRPKLLPAGSDPYAPCTKQHVRTPDRDVAPALDQAARAHERHRCRRQRDPPWAIRPGAAVRLVERHKADVDRNDVRAFMLWMQAHLIVLVIRLDTLSADLRVYDALNASLASNRFPVSETARPKSVCVFQELRRGASEWARVSNQAMFAVNQSTCWRPSSALSHSPASSARAYLDRG